MRCNLVERFRRGGGGEARLVPLNFDAPLRAKAKLLSRCRRARYNLGKYEKVPQYDTCGDFFFKYNYVHRSVCNLSLISMDVSRVAPCYKLFSAQQKKNIYIYPSGVSNNDASYLANRLI